MVKISLLFNKKTIEFMTMLNRLINIYLIITLCAICGGCNEDSLITPTAPIPGAPGTITIHFRSSDLTRSVVSDNSENMLENITIALYPENAGEDSQAVALETFPNPTGDQKHDAIVTLYLTDIMIRDLFEGINGNSCQFFAVANLPKEDIPAKATKSQLKNIIITSNFDTNPQQTSFVMAGEGTITYQSPAAGATIGSAKGDGILRRAAAKINLNVKLPESITIKNAGDSEETWIPVTDQNNLIVYINNGVKKSVTYPVNPVTADGQEPWKPTGENASESYYNSDPTNSGSYRYLQANGQVTENEIIQDPDGKIITQEVTLNQFKTDVPFYTYPNAWSVDDYKDTNQTTLTLIVRWYKAGQGQSQWINYYYQVPVTPNDIYRIDRNYSYSINLKVGMLGSLVPDTPLLVEDCTYKVVNWYKEDLDVEIKDYRYLVVNPNMVAVQNESEVLIPFFSSHPVDYDNVTMTFQRFNYYSNGNGDVVNIEVDENILNASTWTHNIEENGVTKQVTDTICSCSIIKDPTTNQLSLRIKHALDIWTPYNGNTEVRLTGQAGSGAKTIKATDLNISKFVRPNDPDQAYSAYTINIRIFHKDDDSYSEDLTITQYPAMYIESIKNEGGGPDNKGYVWVNNANGTGGNFGGVHGLTGENTNPNMYLINISQLNSSSEYIIGDPRMSYTNNKLSTATNDWPVRYPDLTITNSDGAEAGVWCERAPFLYGTPDNGRTTRRLTYYYPTIESQDDEYKMRIAPKIRVASSYGVTNELNRDKARQRIATYQEVNCPAGRWRLPTFGELQFITTLSSLGKIPELFTVGNAYWTAQGPYRVNSNGTITPVTANNNQYGNYPVRGVYDEWYWENYPQYSISSPYSYTLGDVLRGAE